MERQAIVQFGYDPKKAKRDKGKRELALKWKEDPLYGFPNDIIYFTKTQIEQKLSVSRRFWTKLRPEARWDLERGEACLGRKGVVVKRCSMNDKLWGIYQISKRKGVALSLNDVKKMIMIDIRRSKLYPPGWTDADASPPQWYIDKLQEQGALEGILREIDEATKG